MSAKNISSKELRELRNKFWESKDHKYLKEASLIADKSSTAMFNLAGMQQIIPYLSGKEHPQGKRLFNIQKCIRTNDIDEVGDATHLTMFEMMGNWSLGDYFKEKSIKWSWEFLTDEKYLNLDSRKIAVTVFAGDENAPRDDESAGYWKSVGMPEDRISYLGADDNRRSPGPVGPCGPDTEIFYWIGDKRGLSDLPPVGSNVENDPDNWMEIWNNVFMEYYRDESGKLSKLPSQNVDTGMGFERMAMVLQGKNSPYDTDIFNSIVELISSKTRVPYELDNISSIRIFADHIRTSFFMIYSGLIPTNEGAGYVLRNLIRRFFYRFSVQGIDDEQFLEQLVDQIDVCTSMNGLLISKSANIVSTIKKEMNLFSKTLELGRNYLSKLNSLIDFGDLEKFGNGIFVAYDTYGYPYELSIELFKNEGKMFDENFIRKIFNDKLEQQKTRSRQATKGKFSMDVDWSTYVQGMPPTDFVGYNIDETEYKNMDYKILKDFDVNGQRVLIFDKSPFYAQGGGQTADKGKVVLDSGEELDIVDVKKYEGVFLHIVK